MEVRYPVHFEQMKRLNTEEIRKNFLVENIFINDEINMVYSHIDRIIVGGVKPVKKILSLEAGKEIGADHFLERREIGIINIGGKGKIEVDGKEYQVNNKDCLYVGKGAKEVSFFSTDPKNPAKLYFNSAPAHEAWPVELITIERANKVKLGSGKESNDRTIYQYVHPDVIKSCQLVMGLTILEPENVWNTMPCHTHDRRMEVYFYFDIPENSVVFHMVGEPEETRHIIVRNEQAVIMPSWSIHSGVGTRNYTFIWGMVGENQTFTDMDDVAMGDLK